MLRQAGIIDKKFLFRINRILAICKGEFKEFCFSNCLSWASFYAQVAVNASEVIDFVDKTKPLAR